MLARSAKAKGKRLTAYVREKLLEWAPDLSPRDIMLPATSQPGADLHLSEAALAVYPFCIEAKNTEKINIWSALEQARSHVEGEEMPLVCFTRNKEGRVYVALDMDHFLKLIR